MNFQKKIILDLLFVVQIFCTFAFGGSLFFRMLNNSQGISVSWFLFWELFLILNLILAFRAHKVLSTSITKQTLWSYSIWLCMVTADIAVLFWKSEKIWSNTETFSVVITLLGILTTFVFFGLKRRGISDPIVKGWLALSFKSIPALVLAYKVFELGGGGLSGIAILAGHITIMTRLIPLYFSIKQAGWDKNRVGSAISEVGNEISWATVTIAWLLVL